MSELAARLIRETSFDEVIFDGLDLRRADLGGKELSRCTFRHALLQETRWRGTRIEDCVFEGCDLTRADVTGAALRGARFSGSKLMGIDWSHVSDFPDVSFVDCNLEYASFVGLALRKTRFERCVMTECNFIRVDLRQASIEDGKLTGTRFDDCDLTGASLLRSVGGFVDPRTNRVKGLRISEDAAVALAESFGMKVGGRGRQ